MVLLEHESGNWAAYFSTDVDMVVKTLLETGANRWAIEEQFHDVKEVWGAGQQQVRNVWSNIGCWHLNNTLMAGVRRHDMARGKFRDIQNYIGVYGRPIQEARFVPIAPESLHDGMARWERYLHEETHDVLVQAAVVHAEFESLHPFLDGNGRIGRMLIPLYLFDRRLLQSPIFYLSEYLEVNRQEYYDRLLAVSRDDDWTGWCQFFLTAIQRQASANEAKARQILALYEEKKSWFIELTHSQYAVPGLDWFFSRPVFKTPTLWPRSRFPRDPQTASCGLPRNTDSSAN